MHSVSGGCATSMPKKVLFDLHVVLDVMEARSPHLVHSGPALEMAYQQNIQGVLSASSVDTLCFLLQRSLSVQRARSIIKDLLAFFEVATVSDETIRRAMALNFKDLEDAIVYQAALDHQCDYLLTRNLRDFPSSGDQITVISPQMLRA